MLTTSADHAVGRLSLVDPLVLRDEGQVVRGFAVTVATGTAVTVIDELPDFPSLVAVIVAAPAPTAVTTPLAETVATAGVLLDQVTTRPVNTLPEESLVVALSGTVPPATTLADAGVTVTVATGTTVTVIADVPDLPSLVAVIVADPTATAFTIPLVETVAMPANNHSLVFRR